MPPVGIFPLFFHNTFCSISGNYHIVIKCGYSYPKHTDIYCRQIYRVFRRGTLFGFIGVFGPQAQEMNEERLRQIWDNRSESRYFSPSSSVALSFFTPAGRDIDDFIATSADNAVTLISNGYLITDRPIEGLNAHIRVAAGNIASTGFRRAVADLTGGCFNLIAIDKRRDEYSIAVDPVGTVPIYSVEIEGGRILSNNPAALCKTELFEPDMDTTGAAEWCLFSYALGKRYPVRQIRMLRMGEFFRWRDGTGSIHSYSRLWDKLPFTEAPPVEEVAEGIRAACERLARVDNHPAQLQSSGFDSRLLTAAWPEASHLHCYTYGNPDAHEISIAGQIAARRGCAWTTTWQHGDDIAGILDIIFDSAGIIIWPDHYFAGARQAEDGFGGTLNGLGGDPLIGDTYLDYNKYLGKHLTSHRLLCRYYDMSIADVGKDAITEALYRALCQVSGATALGDFLSDEYIGQVRNSRLDILQDIRRELDYVETSSDSLALLWRNFLYANRIPNMVSQQMTMLMQHVLVYCPITNDTAFHDLVFRLPAKDVAYYRYYRKVYRRCFSEYASIPYGDTLIPISRPLWNHKIAAILLNRGVHLPPLTNPANGQPRDPNSWAIWMRESKQLRDHVYRGLTRAGMCDKKRLKSMLDDITTGRRPGGGKAFHLLSLAKWISMCREYRKHPAI